MVCWHAWQCSLWQCSLWQCSHGGNGGSAPVAALPVAALPVAATLLAAFGNRARVKVRQSPVVAIFTLPPGTSDFIRLTFDTISQNIAGVPCRTSVPVPQRLPPRWHYAGNNPVLCWQTLSLFGMTVLTIRFLIPPLSSRAFDFQSLFMKQAGR